MDDAVLAALADGVTVVTANNRLARSIILAWNKRQKAAGRKVWVSPDVLPWNAWLERLRDASVESAGEAGRLTLLDDFQARFAWRQIIEKQRPESAWGVAASMADVAGRAWQVCRAWRIDPASLRDTADSHDSALFAQWAVAFEVRCAEQGWADSSTLPDLLAQDLANGAVRAPSRLVAAGFDEWTPQQRHLLQWFECSGTQLTQVPIPRRDRASLAQVPCTDMEAELVLAARWARALRESRPDAVVGVVVPDLAQRAGQVRRTFLDVIAPDWRLREGADTAVNLSYGEPLAAVPMVHIALLALEALQGRLDYRSVGQLLRTPYLQGADAEAALRASLDVALRERIGTSIDLEVEIAQNRSMAPMFSERLARMLERRRSWSVRQPAARWAAEFSAALAVLGWPGDRALDSEEYQARMAWQKLLECFARVDTVVSRLSLTGALALLREMAQRQIFQPEGHSEAIQVMGALEAVGQVFDGLWVCGLTSESWPPCGRPNPLLPLAMQRRLAMPDSSPALIRERAERLLRHLAGSAPIVYLSWPQTRGDEPLAPSPLLQGVAVAEPARVPRWLAPAYRETLLSNASLEMLTLDPPPPLGTEPLAPGGAALLALQARCPARAFAEFRLGVREMPLPVPGISPRLRGIIVHAVLERFFAGIPEQAALLQLGPQERYERLSVIAREKLRQRLGTTRRFVMRIADLEHARLVPILAQFVELECQRPAFVVEAREEDHFRQLGPLRLRLRPDRVDRLAGGGRLVIDYKSGSGFTPRDWLGTRLREPQLPLYAVLFDATAVAVIELRAQGVRRHAVACGGQQLPGSQEPAEFSAGRFPDWKALREAWRGALESVAAEFASGDFRIDLNDLDLARGPWAMLTRVYELEANAAEADE